MHITCATIIVTRG